MYLPPLRLDRGFESYTSGDLRIDPSAAIAPGTILQAEQDCHIEIGAGACIGAGAIIHAVEGSIKIGSGVALGSGVLVVGHVKIGANACIGSVTTIWNQNVDAGAVIAPGSLIAPLGRQVPEVNGAIAPSSSEPKLVKKVSVEVSEVTDLATAKPESTEITTVDNSGDRKPKVYGQDKLNQMLESLFPHRQALKQSLPNQNYQDPNDPNSSSG